MNQKLEQAIADFSEVLKEIRTGIDFCPIAEDCRFNYLCGDKNSYHHCNHMYYALDRDPRLLQKMMSEYRDRMEGLSFDLPECVKAQKPCHITIGENQFCPETDWSRDYVCAYESIVPSSNGLKRCCFETMREDK